MRAARPPALLALVLVLITLLAACGGPQVFSNISGSVAEGSSEPARSSAAPKAAAPTAPASAAKPAAAPKPAASTANDAAKAGGGSGAAAPGAPPAPAATPAPSTGQVASAAGNLPTLDQRIIRTGRIDVTVLDISESLRSITTLVRNAGGYIQQSATKEQGPITIAEAVVRVPVEQYDGVFQSLRDLAVPDIKPVESSESQDVTEEFADTQARITNLKVTEAQLLKLLSTAEKMEDILVVQREVTAVREQIERLQGRLNVLERRSAFSTIAVTLRPHQAVKKPLPPALLAPASNASSIDTRPFFRWATTEGATTYDLQVTSDIDTLFADPLLNAAKLRATEYAWASELEDLRQGIVYRWRVRGSNTAGDSEWSPVRTFTTVPVWSPLPRVSQAWAESIKFLQQATDAILSVAVFFWWLIGPALIFFILLWNRVGRTSRRSQPAVAAATTTGTPPPADTPPTT
jgi:hypothetical protein